MAKRHVFLSYCREDLQLVRKIHDDLVALGEPVWWDEDILVGRDWSDEIKRAMHEAYAVVVCFSSEMSKRLRSGVYPEIREAIAILRELHPEVPFIFPIRLSECQLPLVKIDDIRSLDSLQSVDLFPPTRYEHELHRLVQSIRSSPQSPKLPGESETLQRISFKVGRPSLQHAGRLPRLIPTYRQRTQYFEQALKTLEADNRSWGAAIVGIGGVGKTSLAISIAEQCQKERNFDKIVWTTAKRQQFSIDTRRLSTPGSRCPDEFAGLLDAILESFEECDGDEATTAEKHSKARKLLSGSRCLLLIDNLETWESLETLADFLERSPPTTKTISTTRTQFGGRGERQVHLLPMNRSEVKELVNALCTFREFSIDESHLDAFYSIVGGIPLAIEWGLEQLHHSPSAGAFIDRLRDARQRGVLNKSEEYLLDFCFRESYDALELKSQLVLQIVGLLGNELSPSEVAYVSRLDSDDVDETLRKLQVRSFLTQNTSSRCPTYSVLPLTRMFIRSIVSAPSQRKTLLQRYASFRTSVRAKRSTICVFTPDLQPITLPRGSTTLDFAYNVHSEIGHTFQYARVNDDYSDAKRIIYSGDLVEVATGDGKPNSSWLKFVKSRRAKNAINRFLNPNRAWISVRKGNELSRQGNIKSSLDQYTEACRLEPQNGWCLNRCGQTLRLSGNLAQARNLHQRALEVNRDDAFAHVGLGCVDYQSGAFEHAKRHFEMALSIDAKYFNASFGLARAMCGCYQYSTALEHLRILNHRRVSRRLLPSIHWVQMVANLGLGEVPTAINECEQSLLSFREFEVSQRLQRPNHGTHFLYYYCLALASAGSANFRTYLQQARAVCQTTGLMQEILVDISLLSTAMEKMLDAKRPGSSDKLSEIRKELKSTFELTGA